MVARTACSVPDSAKYQKSKTNTNKAKRPHLWDGRSGAKWVTKERVHLAHLLPSKPSEHLCIPLRASVSRATSQ